MGGPEPDEAGTDVMGGAGPGPMRWAAPSPTRRGPM